MKLVLPKKTSTLHVKTTSVLSSMTFAEEYNTYMNEKSETAKLLKVVELKDKQLAEAKANAEEKAKLVESKDAEIKDAVESQRERNNSLN